MILYVALQILIMPFTVASLINTQICHAYDYLQLKLLNWHGRPLLNVTQTNLLLNKLQELSIARVRPGYIEPDLPAQALSSVRLALATNLGRAILED